MKIKIIQQDKKVIIEFHDGNFMDTYEVDQAEDFLAAVDKFLKKSDNDLTILENAELEFIGVGMLTERIVRSIMAGLKFS